MARPPVLPPTSAAPMVVALKKSGSAMATTTAETHPMNETALSLLVLPTSTPAAVESVSLFIGAAMALKTAPTVTMN